MDLGSALASLAADNSGPDLTMTLITAGAALVGAFFGGMLKLVGDDRLTRRKNQRESLAVAQEAATELRRKSRAYGNVVASGKTPGDANYEAAEADFTAAQDRMRHVLERIDCTQVRERGSAWMTYSEQLLAMQDPDTNAADEEAAWLSLVTNLGIEIRRYGG